MIDQMIDVTTGLIRRSRHRRHSVATKLAASVSPRSGIHRDFHRNSVQVTILPFRSGRETGRAGQSLPRAGLETAAVGFWDDTSQLLRDESEAVASVRHLPKLLEAQGRSVPWPAEWSSERLSEYCGS